VHLGIVVNARDPIKSMLTSCEEQALASLGDTLPLVVNVTYTRTPPAHGAMWLTSDSSLSEPVDIVTTPISFLSCEHSLK